ncbi:replication initiator [Actinacidiphila bryophytorum]|uniref:Replication initiator protein n=1 Tax=Actinacidiphila bryophytorum TaxID=1436133 RepID=A0A9W4E7T9_9ACTN|nr:replication initiator [Actinacidiphila bryophytorum]MBM9436057.1 plasmid replication initiator protein [Actinacidiphila bryophytorum]MBN6542143.1 plasmid replication initiator protein [Actinacidiphila bryophytorum]CAG7634856.1 Replication initiator protein [Actinacidiphila bryophytorum]
MLARAARLRQLSETDRDILRLANHPQFDRWLQQITATGGCAHPIHLSGTTTTRDALTGEVLHHYDTADEPYERLSVRCRNRRATVCPSCSRLHAGDTYHLVRAGLMGGKNIPTGVRQHPRLFITLTAPSFGAVHRAATAERPICRPHRRAVSCEHGRPTSCREVHDDPTDPRPGQPLCPGCYDYTAHVLWHAHAGRLWKAFTDNLYHHLAAQAGQGRTALRRSVRISYAKVAEYQRRAAVHVHAVLRADGAGGAEDLPPSWVDAPGLADAVRTAAAVVRLTVPYARGLGEYELRWGAQLDARPLRAATGHDALTDDAVAAYVAKYVTKGAADTGAGTDHPVRSQEDIAAAAVCPHVRALMAACWRLGGLAELEHLRLREWAHSLGYRGHILTKSRRYSTTYAALRSDRADHTSGETEAGVSGPDAVTEAAWRYVGSGHTPGAAQLAAGIAEDLARSRHLYAEAQADREWGRQW